MGLLACQRYSKDLEICRAHVLRFSDLTGMRILVTGAAGMLGGFLVDVLCRACREEGEDIEIFALGRDISRLNKRFRGWEDLKKLHLIQHDVNNAMPNSMPPVDYVIHAAGNAFPHVLYQDPVGTIQANVQGTLHLLDYMYRTKGRRFLYVSTGEIYGQAVEGIDIFSENYCGNVDLLSPRSCYPLAKRCAENLCISYWKQFGVDCVIVRPCHTYGANYTERDNRANVQFVDLAAQGKDIVLKSKGEQVRSYAYVADTISGMLSVLLAGKTGEAYNLSNSLGTISIAGYAMEVAKAAGVSIRFEKDASEASPFSRAVLDNRKLEKLGWNPAYTLEEGIRSTVEIARFLKNKGKAKSAIHGIG